MLVLGVAEGKPWREALVPRLVLFGTPFSNTLRNALGARPGSSTSAAGAIENGVKKDDNVPRGIHSTARVFCMGAGHQVEGLSCFFGDTGVSVEGRKAA